MKYIDELDAFISKINEYMSLISATSSIDYFINLFNSSYKPKDFDKINSVGIIGDEFYSLYVKASGLNPVFLNGGSYSTGENASDIFPQISDPVAKSTLGLLLDEELGLYKSIGTIIISATNDSYKKSINYLRDLNINVIEVDYPPYIVEKMPISYVFSQVKILNEISKIANTRLSETVLKAELNYCKQAYNLIHNTYSEQWNSIPTLVQDFLLQTLYLDDTKSAWCSEIEVFLKSVQVREDITPLLLMGSSMKFPCYKMYDIFNDLGIDRFKNSCCDLPYFHKIPMKNSSMSLMNECFKYQYKNSFCSQTLTDTNKYNFSNKNIKGIVYHLLKGQVSSAYEAEQVEKVAYSQNIPFICVETDYTNADKEQIKIRIEAFCEMLKVRAS